MSAVNDVKDVVEDILDVYAGELGTVLSTTIQDVLEVNTQPWRKVVEAALEALDAGASVPATARRPPFWVIAWEPAPAVAAMGVRNRAWEVGCTITRVFDSGSDIRAAVRANTDILAELGNRLRQAGSPVATPSVSYDESIDEPAMASLFDFNNVRLMAGALQFRCTVNVYG